MAHLTFRRLEQEPVSEWLQRWAEGDDDAAERLAERVYPLFERAAREALRGNPAAAGDMGARTLIAEVWIKLTPRRQAAFANRHAFFGAAVRQMQYVLIDRFRKALAQQKVYAHVRAAEAPEAPDGPGTDLQRALEWLCREHERPAQVLLMRELCGLDSAETGAALGLSPATVKRDLAYARARLRMQMRSP